MLSNFAILHWQAVAISTVLRYRAPWDNRTLYTRRYRGAIIHMSLSAAVTSPSPRVIDFIYLAVNFVPFVSMTASADVLGSRY